MLKYLTKLSDKFRHFKNGVVKYAAQWVGFSESPATIQADIDEIDSLNSEINRLEQLLKQKNELALKMKKEKEQKLEELENKAKAVHSSEPLKLIEYGIKERKARSPKSRPTSNLIIKITDDTDNIGFKLKVSRDRDANFYEWERGISEDPTDTNKIPKMKFFKITTTTQLIDNEVKKGERVWYRVRAANTHGAGPWCEPLNKIQ